MFIAEVKIRYEQSICRLILEAINRIIYYDTIFQFPVTSLSSEKCQVFYFVPFFISGALISAKDLVEKLNAGLVESLE